MAIAVIIIVAAVSIWAIVRLTRVAPRPAPGRRTRSAGRRHTSSAAWGGTSGYVYGQGGFDGGGGFSDCGSSGGGGDCGWLRSVGEVPGAVMSDVRKTSDVGSLLQCLLATQPVGGVKVVGGCREMRRYVRSRPLPASRSGGTVWRSRWHR